LNFYFEGSSSEHFDDECGKLDVDWPYTKSLYENVDRTFIDFYLNLVSLCISLTLMLAYCSTDMSLTY
jgi:hypothetical protein